MLEFSPKDIKKAQRESIPDFEKEQQRKRDVEKAKTERDLIREANRIVNEGATYTNQDKADLRKSEHKHTRRTPSGRITPRGYRSITAGTLVS